MSSDLLEYRPPSALSDAPGLPYTTQYGSMPSSFPSLSQGFIVHCVARNESKHDPRRKPIFRAIVFTDPADANGDAAIERVLNAAYECISRWTDTFCNTAQRSEEMWTAITRELNKSAPGIAGAPEPTSTSKYVFKDYSDGFVPLSSAEGSNQTETASQASNLKYHTFSVQDTSNNSSVPPMAEMTDSSRLSATYIEVYNFPGTKFAGPPTQRSAPAERPVFGPEVPPGYEVASVAPATAVSSNATGKGGGGRGAYDTTGCPKPPPRPKPQ